MNAVAEFQKPRLPYHEAIEARYGVDRSGWKALTEAVFPNAKSVDSVVMALSYCKARKLDPFKRPVHIVPMWSANERRMVETVWPGVSEIRTTAFRTGQFAGMDAAEFGDKVTSTLKGKDDKGNVRESTLTYPTSCQITVYRILAGQRCAFVGPIVYWLEAYGRWKNTEAPNDMWAKRPFGQLEKCAEAAALRRAFPEEIGNDYAAEEMEGHDLIHDGDAKPAAIAATRRAPPPPAIEHKAAEETTPSRRAPPHPAAESEEQRVVKVEQKPADFATIKASYLEAASSAEDPDQLESAWQEIVEGHFASLAPEDGEALLQFHHRRIEALTP